jgi:hypothetical protein
MSTLVPTLFDFTLTDIPPVTATVSRARAEELFVFFQQHRLFNWKAANNGCEGRADAVCVLLDEWDIPNYKAWAFGGAFLRKAHVGELRNNWGYHVAPVLPVNEGGEVRHYVLDPAVGKGLLLIEEWAATITQLPHSYHCIRRPHWYIFPAKDILTEDWHHRDKRNRKWMIQALAGINGLEPRGKARLVFNKARIKRTAAAFAQAKKEKPF